VVFAARIGESGDWGIAGNGLTTADVHALQGRTPAPVAG
jgi:hypothetical protein